MIADLNARNSPPKHGLLVPIDHHRSVIRTLLETTDLHRPGITLLTETLLDCDLRCVFSHGTRQLPRYLEALERGAVNASPEIRVVSDSGSTAVVDGDGGMGHEACSLAMEIALEKTAGFGMAACTTRNHHHIGAAGVWARQAASRGFIGVTVASARRELGPEMEVLDIVDPSPISIAFPNGEQPPLVLDMGSRLVRKNPTLQDQEPRLYFKALGISAAIQTLGGLLAGVNRAELRPPVSRWQSHQTAFLCTWDPARFLDAEEFVGEVDDFVRVARSMRPMHGTTRAELPGGPEWLWERQNRERGIPLGDEHRALLEGLAAKLDVDCGYEAFEATRY